MKKFMKGCAITALILMVVGAVLALVAGTMRKSPVIASVVEEATGGRVHANFGWPYGKWGIFWDGWWKDAVEVKYEVDISAFDKSHEIIDGNVLNSADLLSGQYSFSPEDVKSLEIRVGGCSFETKPSDNGLYYLKVKGIGKIQFYLDNDGELHIIAVNVGKNNWNSLTNLSWTGSIIFYVPEGYSYDEVDIEMGAGDLVFDDLIADEISLEVGAGNIKINNVEAKKLEAAAGLGQLEIYGMDVEKLEAEVGMGNLTVQGSLNGDGSVECAMGNVEMMLKGSEQDFNYRLEAAAGNIDLGRSSYSGLGQERRINNGASKKLDVECSMGNISINFIE